MCGRSSERVQNHILSLELRQERGSSPATRPHKAACAHAHTHGELRGLSTPGQQGTPKICFHWDLSYLKMNMVSAVTVINDPIWFLINLKI